jgi:hypothetical protein
MAEVAIPVLALGALYLINNDRNGKNRNNKNNRKEGFDNVSAQNQRRLISGDATTYQPTSPPINYPKPRSSGVDNNVKYYKNPNAATDRYFQQSVYENAVDDKSNPVNNLTFKSLTGNDVKKTDIKHNNMKPFFGSRVRQRTVGLNSNESHLDYAQGRGSLHVSKKAVAPLFAPQKNMQWAHGAPNTSDFIQSRMNPSRNISNTKPWEEIRVGPGLNKGFTNEGSNGFNSGMEARDSWRPKNVDELRTKTNPKVTFGLANLEGPAQGTFVRGIEGKIEKNRPDTFYLNTPDRWFTTNGQEKGQTVRSAQVMQPIKSNDGREYFGNGNGNQDGASLAGPAEQNFRKSRRPILAPFDKYKGPAHNMSYKAGGDSTKDDYGKDGYNALPNSRTTGRQADEFGIVSGWLKAITAPVMDMLRPSRKENLIGNMRPNGNAGGAYGVNEARVWNPADRLKTTIKEQTIDNKYDSAPYQKKDGGFEVTEYDAPPTHRESYLCPYTGNGQATGLTTAGPVYNAAYNANLNPNKEILSAGAARPTQGNMSLLNSNQNIAISKIGATRPAQIIPSMPKQPPNMSTYGTISGNNMRSQNISRNNTGLLTAFDNNPYTQSLSSVA